jgi:UDP-N-acetylglucosamine:LPS N-acetylglucosamine transferase
MSKNRTVLVTDRGGHLQNALMLISQMGKWPAFILTTNGPEVYELRSKPTKVHVLPYLFSWLGKRRFLNPLKVLYQFTVAFILVLKIRPRVVISLGALDVIPFCLISKLVGARIIHVECMNQVTSPSWTGKLLYPFCSGFYVQWPELLKRYGKKARYEGWVID